MTPNRLPLCWTSKHIRTLIQSFTETEKYLALQPLAQMFIKEVQSDTKIEDQKLD